MKLIAHVSHFFHPNALVTHCPSPKISRSLYATTYKIIFIHSTFHKIDEKSMKEAISVWIPTISRQGAAFASLLGLRGSGAGAFASGTLASRAFASGAGDMDRSPGAFLGS